MVRMEFPVEGGGETGALIQSHDWASTSLGPICRWPDCLRFAVRLMLPARSQMVIFWGPEFVAIYNDAYAEVIGNKHPGALGRPAREIWTELWGDLGPLLQRVYDEGETIFAEDRSFRLERYGYPEDVSFDISYSPLRDETNAIRGVICIVNETTDRVEARRALAKAQERLSYALSASGMIGTFDWHIQSDEFFSDAQFAAMFSVDPHRDTTSVSVMEYLARIHPDDRERIAAAVDHAIETGEKYAQECRYLQPDGTVRWIEVRGGIVYDASGKAERFAGAAVDITDRKEREEALHRLAAIVASSEDAIMSTDLDVRITSWNRGAERLYGYSAEEAIGRPATFLLPEDRADEEPMIIERIRRGERIETYETKRRRRDGTLVDVSLTVSPVHDFSGRIVGASKIARDITERKKAERLERYLIGELKHRVKNTLATVRAIARQTFGKESSREVREAFDARLLSLSRAHDLLTARNWNGAELSAVIAEVLAPYEKERFEIAGPAVLLPAKSVLTFSLALHELATNAAKYGALSHSSGKVSITWTLGAGAVPQLDLRWEERGGPLVSEPVQKGFGSKLIEEILSAELDGEAGIFFEPSGVVCKVRAPMSVDEDPAVPGRSQAAGSGR